MSSSQTRCSVKTYFSDLPSLRRTTLKDIKRPEHINRVRSAQPGRVPHPPSPPRFSTSHVPKYFSSPVTPFAYEHLPKEQWISTPLFVASKGQLAITASPERLAIENNNNTPRQQKNRLRANKNKKRSPGTSTEGINAWGEWLWTLSISKISNNETKNRSFSCNFFCVQFSQQAKMRKCWRIDHRKKFYTLKTIFFWPATAKGSITDTLSFTNTSLTT